MGERVPGGRVGGRPGSIDRTCAERAPGVYYGRMSRCCFLLALMWLSSATPLHALTLFHYNAHGNSVTNWTTNSAQVKAIGRQVAYLQPDVVDFNEIPLDYTYEMTNFVKAFLPGY